MASGFTLPDGYIPMTQVLTQRGPTLVESVEIPWLGLGTFRLKGAEAEEAVTTALGCGYRHIDTATCYGNERAVGKAVAQWREGRGLPVFLTTKVQPRDMRSAHTVMSAFERSLQQLGVDKVALYLLHWPGVSKRPPDSPAHSAARREAWEALERLHLEGRAGAIGVSNFTQAHLEDLLYGEGAMGGPLRVRVVPHVNQVECHPQYQQRRLRAFCGRLGIQLVAYSPFGVGELLSHPVVIDIASRHQPRASPAAVLLRWALQQGIPTLPKSAAPARIRENFEATLSPDWEMSASDLSLLHAMDIPLGKKTWDPHQIK